MAGVLIRDVRAVTQREDHVKTLGKHSYLLSKSRGFQKTKTQTSSLQNCETIGFYCLIDPVCGTLSCSTGRLQLKSTAIIPKTQIRRSLERQSESCAKVQNT